MTVFATNLWYFFQGKTGWGQPKATTQLLHHAISQNNSQPKPLQGHCFGERGVNPSPSEQS